eukprot:2262186-Pleurochrysis_carterae.AAC.7
MTEILRINRRDHGLPCKNHGRDSCPGRRGCRSDPPRLWPGRLSAHGLRGGGRGGAVGNWGRTSRRHVRARLSLRAKRRRTRLGESRLDIGAVVDEIATKDLAQGSAAAVRRDAGD